MAFKKQITFIFNGDEYKKCSYCNRDRQVSLFRVRRIRKTDNKTVYKSQCKECEQILNTKRYFKKYSKNEAHRRRAYKYTLKNRYGLTQEDYATLYNNQEGKCLVCFKVFPSLLEQRKGLVVDHCHSSNRVRGLLCTRCNVGMGQLGDNIEFLSNAIKYLKEY